MNIMKAKLDMSVAVSCQLLCHGDSIITASHCVAVTVSVCHVSICVAEGG